MKSPHFRVALVYDRVNTPFGGAENVLNAIQEIFPDAPLFTSVYDPNRAEWAKNFTIIPSFLQQIPFAKKFHRLLVFAMPLAFESLDFEGFDVIISITSAEAKGVLTKPNQLHICYLLTPTRYLWSHTDEYQRHWLTGWIGKRIFGYLRWWDEVAALRPDVFIPISNRVAERCRTFYHREPDPVLYPTVATASTSIHSSTTIPQHLPQEYYLIVSRLVPYKRIDLAIQACVRAQRNLIIIGQGPDRARLETLAHESMKQSQTSSEKSHLPSQIIFLNAVQTTEIGAYYLHCRAFSAPAEEDFGMTVLEAQSAGKPVIVYAQSGGAELVTEGVSGIHFFQQTVEDVAEAIHLLESRTWDATQIRKNMTHYTKKMFQKDFQKRVEDAWKKFSQTHKTESSR